MPFAIYKVENNLFNNLDKLDFENLKDFNGFISLLNKKNRAILIDKEKNNIFNTLKDKIVNLGREGKWGEFTYDPRFADNKSLTIRETLMDCLGVFNDSYKCLTDDKYEKGTKKDFVKNSKNKFDIEIYHKFNHEIIDPSDFENLNMYKKEFLDRLEIFIASSVSDEKVTKGKKKRINAIYLFHKELSDYLLPDKRYVTRNETKEVIKKFLSKSIKENVRDPSVGAFYNKKLNKNTTYYPDGVKKIEAGTKFFLDWWKNMPEDIRPIKFVIITDIPTLLKKEHFRDQQLTKLKFEEFLFEELENVKLKPKIEFLDRRTVRGPWDWTHKKHFAFSKKTTSLEKSIKELSLLINSDFGVEFINPNYKNYRDDKNNLRLREDNKLSIIDKKKSSAFRQILGLLNEKDI